MEAPCELVAAVRALNPCLYLGCRAVGAKVSGFGVYVRECVPRVGTVADLEFACVGLESRLPRGEYRVARYPVYGRVSP